MKTILAALLHDIGKFYQRTGDNIDNAYLRFSKNGGYIHASYTAQFITNELKYNFDQPYKLVNESAGHHNDADGIVKKADIIASAHDRKDAEQSAQEEQNDNYKIVRLYTIFDEVSINKDKFKGKFLNVDSLFNQTYKEENTLTVEEAQNEYKALYKEFISDIEKINYSDINDYETLHQLLYPIIKNYTTAIPANTQGNMPTVSLYEHLKFTAAIAACLEKTNNKEPFIIFDYDLSGIQSFIYKITEGGNSKDKISKSLRTRSFYLSLLADFISCYIINKFNLSYENILYSSSGRGRLLLPNIDNFNTKINEICDEVEKELYYLHNGQLGIIFSYIPFNEQELCNTPMSEYGDNQKKVRLNSKSRKFKSIISDTKFKFINKPYKKVCVMCQTRETGSVLCDFCSNMIKLNDVIISKTDKFIVEYDFNNIESKSDFSIQIGNLGNINIYKKFDNAKMINKNNYYFSINSYTIGEIKTYAMSVNKNISFEDIAKFKLDNSNKGDNKLAVIKMDVDNLGYIFLKGLDGKSTSNVDKNTFSKLLNLSRTLDMFFSNQLPKICGENTYINYSGGDDLVIVVPASISLDVVEMINREFNKYTDNNSSFTISAGIDIFEYNSPVRYAIARAEEALEKSKNEENKNSFTTLDVSISNKELSSINLEIKEFVKALNNNLISRGVIYDIYSAILMSLDYDEENDIKERYMKFIPHIAYSIKRNITNETWLNKFKQIFIFTDINISMMKKYKVILGYTLMNTREETNNETI